MRCQLKGDMSNIFADNGLLETSHHPSLSSATSRSKTGSEQQATTSVSRMFHNCSYDQSKSSWLTLLHAVVDLECSSNAPCPNITFKDFDVAPANGSASSFICVNVVDEVGLPGE